MVNSYYHSSGAQHTIIDEHVQKASPHGRWRRCRTLVRCEEAGFSWAREDSRILAIVF